MQPVVARNKKNKKTNFKNRLLLGTAQEWGHGKFGNFHAPPSPYAQSHSRAFSHYLIKWLHYYNLLCDPKISVDFSTGNKKSVLTFNMKFKSFE